MSDHDVFRWADTQTLMLSSTQIATEATPPPLSRQMLQANWQRPCVWRLMVSVQPKIVNPVSTITFAVQVLLNVGIGQVMQTVPLTTLTFATPFAPTLQFFDIPAEAISLQFQVAAAPPIDPNDAVILTAWTAPHAEPGSLAQIRDAVGAQRHGIASPDAEGLPRWMQSVGPNGEPGWEDGELRYRR